MGAAESTPEVVEAKESPQNSEFDDLSAQDIESDEEEIEYEEPEDEGRDSPNSRISDLDWVNTLSLSQLQRLEEAISLQKSQKEREEKTKTNKHLSIATEYQQEVDRIQKLKEQIKTVTDKNQRAKLIELLKNEGELLKKRQKSGYYKLAKSPSAEKTRYTHITAHIVTKDEKPEDVLGLYGIAREEDSKDPIVIPFEGTVVERSVRTPPKLDSPIVESPDTLKSQEIARKMQRMHEMYSAANLVPPTTSVREPQQAEEAEGGCIIN